MNIKSKGFTLIELLVVISIISLLSSVVLASVNDARDKAKARAFRASVMQFVNALELYRSDKGYYPGENLLSTNPVFVSYSYTGSPETPISTSGFDLKEELTQYIPNLPDPVLDGSQFNYVVNGSIAGVNKCFGDTKKPIYHIRISSKEQGVFDWPFLEGFLPNTFFDTYKCFSLK